jgi:hypothetical protein
MMDFSAIRELYADSGSFIPSFVFLAAALVVYLIARTVYRLYFSPVAKFPGPKLAAISFW